MDKGSEEVDRRKHASQVAHQIQQVGDLPFMHSMNITEAYLLACPEPNWVTIQRVASCIAGLYI